MAEKNTASRRVPTIGGAYRGVSRDVIARGRLAARASAAVLPCVLSAKVAALGLQHLMALQWLSRGDKLLHAVADEASSAHLF